MSAYYLIRAVGKGVSSFWRCGRKWTAEGVKVARDAFTEAEWERLSEEKMLSVTPVSDAQEVEGARIDLKEAFAQAVATLPPEAFGKDGTPKMEPLREIDGLQSLGTADRDAFWAEIKAAGGEAPSA